ncbi:MAG TPA: hypothetical protein VNM15_04795, partial [Candidatus Binatia bacterium]|nr:hypothetical protein [Candidatus Binatia bacterium]
GGISALAAQRYDNLRALMQAVVPDPARSRGETSLIRATIDGLSDINDGFKIILCHEPSYTPRSDHVFKLLQPTLRRIAVFGVRVRVVV